MSKPGGTSTKRAIAIAIWLLVLPLAVFWQIGRVASSGGEMTSGSLWLLNGLILLWAVWGAWIFATSGKSDKNRNPL